MGVVSSDSQVLSKLLTKLDKASFSFHCGKATQHDVLRHSFFDWGGGSIFGSKDSKVTSYLLNGFFKAPFCVSYGRLANAWCTLTLTRFWKVVGKGKLCSNVSKVPSELLTRLFKAPFCVRYGGVPTAWFTQTFIPCYPIMTTLLALRRSNRAESIREICNTISYLFSSYEYFRWKGQALISKDTECNFKNNFSLWIFQQHPWDDT